MKTAKIVLTLSELRHLQNDVIYSIYHIKKTIFGGDYSLETWLSKEETKQLTKEKEQLLKDYGYYSRLELKEKLGKFERENFEEICSRC